MNDKRNAIGFLLFYAYIEIVATIFVTMLGPSDYEKNFFTWLPFLGLMNLIAAPPVVWLLFESKLIGFSRGEDDD